MGYFKMREIARGKYEDRGYSNEESIAYLQLQKPEQINGFLTYNFGMDDDRFPLSFMTEVKVLVVLLILVLFNGLGL
jgi:hypothetical protein